MQSVDVKKEQEVQSTKKLKDDSFINSKSKKVLFTILAINTFFIVLGLFMGSPEEVFGKEASFITWVSFAQLLSISIIITKITA